MGADLGTRAGRNLFHSSERFSLATGERARTSMVRSARRSRAPIFYFINHAGVAFGPDARRDLQGSFHVPTADELRFADDIAFSAASSFSIATPDDTGASDASAGISIEAESVTIGSDPVVTVDALGSGVAGRQRSSGGSDRAVGPVPGRPPGARGVAARSGERCRRGTSGGPRAALRPQPCSLTST